MKNLIIKIFLSLDLILSVLVYPSAWLLKNIRRQGVHKLPNCKKVLMRVGVLPIRDHYYEPKFEYRNLKEKLTKDRKLPGIKWNVDEQLKILKNFKYSIELENIQHEKASKYEFYLNNKAFESGDAEYWYQMIRFIKPKRIFEVGSGNSTLMAIKAIYKNEEEDKEYECKHVCIEPFEMKWLEETGIRIVRKKVEDVGTDFFLELGKNDVLFIDSSHVIRPEGDVVFEYLELLPLLNKGVIVHIHDIFSPKNYPQKWLVDEIRLWNEQYLLEAFLSENNNWKIIGAINFLHNNHYEELKRVTPFLNPQKEPASFYIQKL